MNEIQCKPKIDKQWDVNKVWGSEKNPKLIKYAPVYYAPESKMELRIELYGPKETCFPSLYQYVANQLFISRCAA